MYSEQLLRLFNNRAHAGAMDDPTHTGQSGTPGHGPCITLRLRVEGGTVVMARYLTFGCPAAIGCAEAVSAWSEGQRLDRLAELTAAEVAEWVGPLPEGKEHCPELAASAARSAATNC